jgi:Kef-type K+ transport system membrane component KefB/predicted transcriptional regulator
VENDIFTFLAKSFHWNIILLLGIALFGGTVGGKLFQKLRIPQVVGYIIIGIILGEMFLGVITMETVASLTPLSYLALGMIGFMIGGELKKEVFKKYGKQFTVILLFEGISAFILVSVFASIVGFFILHNWSLSISFGLLLGAISSATAPAATTDVLWEYKTKGPLTRTVLGIVALDDGLALLLFAFAASIANVLIKSDFTIMMMIRPIIEICGSIITGLLLGFLLSQIIKTQTDEDKILVLSLGLILLNLGVTIAMGLDMLLSSMAMGAMVVNYSPKKSKDIFNLTDKFTPPIYILFFVLVGAKLKIAHISIPIFILLLAYLIGRSAGKMFGAYIGAAISSAEESVKKYLPLCLFSQAGVAIGLSILASQRFSKDIGDLIVIVITATTFVVQLIGPPSVKIAIQKANEIGLNITEDDLLKKIVAKEIIEKNIPMIKETANIKQILEMFVKSKYFYFLVVNSEKRLVGIISIEGVKELFLEHELSLYLLAYDIMEPVIVTSSPDEFITDIKSKMEKYDVEYIPVVGPNNEAKGMIERRQIGKVVSKKIMELNEQITKLG